MSTETTNLGLTKAAGTEKYSVDIVNENLDKVDAAIGELREALGENSPIVTALEAIRSSIESDTNSAEIVEVKQNTETLKTKVENINGNVSGNGTKLDTLDGKADVISGQVQTVGNNVSAVKTDIASVKTTIESTSGKADTAVELLNMLKALATAKTKQLICCKGIAQNSEWQTIVNISGSGVLEKAFARSYTEGGYVRITIDDEIVLLTKTAYHDVVGAIKDAVWSNDVIQTVITTSSGSFMWNSIKQNGAWHIGFPGGVEKSYGCMCLIPNGIRFAKNFKFEVKAMETGVTVTGEVAETSVVTTI